MRRYYPAIGGAYRPTRADRAIGVDSFSPIVSDAFIGDPVFTATTTLPVFFTNVSQNDRPELPESMRH
jgi:hypothetical protein